MDKNTVLLEYDAARKNRQFEITMFWTRANYFLVLNTALAIGIFSSKQTWQLLCLSSFGAVAALLWWRTNLGARYWQIYWEAEVHRISKILEIRAFAVTDDEIFSQVLSFGRTRPQSFLRRFVDKGVKKGKGVAYNMILLSLLTLTAWVVIFLSCVGILLASLNYAEMRDYICSV